jgi:hypothetical protein
LDATQLAAEHVLAGSSAEAALQALPCTLPLLLAMPAWQRSTASVNMLLARLTAALQHLHVAKVPSHIEWRQLLRRCLLAARLSLPQDMWPVLAALL